MNQYRQELQIIIGFMSNYFSTQACITAFDIGLNIFLETQLIVFLANKVIGFINTKMFYKRVVVMPADEFCLKSFLGQRVAFGSAVLYQPLHSHF